MLLSSQSIQTLRPETPQDFVSVKALPFVNQGRVLARYSPLDRARGQELIRRVLKLEPQRADVLAARLLEDFGQRHCGLEQMLTYHFHQVLHLMPKSRAAELSPAQKLLIGAYFTQEVEIEAGGLCCPGLVPAPRQSGQDLRLIFCFQALSRELGSSLIFREARLGPDDALAPEIGGGRAALPIIEEFPDRPLAEIEHLIRGLPLSNGLRKQLLKQLPDPYVYADLFQLVDQYRLNCPQPAERKALQQLLEAVDDFYDLHFAGDSQLSERVLSPMLDHESQGLEDARFVSFSDGGSSTFYATYTANGQQSQQRLLQTDDFHRFRSYSLRVPSGDQLALFPRKVKGRYTMLALVDRFHLCLFFSDRITRWQQPILLHEPTEPWELASLGTCGSPLETPQGWLLITQGTGPMGVTLLSACLLDLNDPTRLKARLREPLPLECPGQPAGHLSSSASLIHQDKLLIPFSQQNQPPSLAVIDLPALLARMEPVS